MHMIRNKSLEMLLFELAELTTKQLKISTESVKQYIVKSIKDFKLDCNRKISFSSFDTMNVYFICEFYNVGLIFYWMNYVNLFQFKIKAPHSIYEINNSWHCIALVLTTVVL
jgi:hypothetical protein